MNRPMNERLLSVLHKQYLVRGGGRRSRESTEWILAYEVYVLCHATQCHYASITRRR